MFYRKILHQAWTTTWKNKYLWFFGLFAAFLGGSGGSEIVFKIFSRQAGIGFLPTWQKFADTGIFSFRAIKNFFSLILSDPISFVILLSIFLILVILGGFLFWLSVVSQAALVSNSAKSATGKKHDFKEGIETGMKNFWSVFSINVGLKAIVFFGLVLISLPILIHARSFGLLVVNLIFVVLFLLFIPLAMVLLFVARYAICQIVIKGDKWRAALENGWKLFKTNWLITLEMSILLFFVNFAVALILILSFLILAVPILFIAILLANLTFIFTFWIIIIFAAFLLLFIAVSVGAALSTFQISAWTALFIQLIGKGGASKLVRVFDKK